jgi:hypothetical protein
LIPIRVGSSCFASSTTSTDLECSLNLISRLWDLWAVRFAATEDRQGRVLAAWEAAWVDSAVWVGWVLDLVDQASAALGRAALVSGVLVLADLDWVLGCRSAWDANVPGTTRKQMGLESDGNNRLWLFCLIVDRKKGTLRAPEGDKRWGID